MTKKWKAGGFPFYTETGKTFVCLITSTNPNFGGPDPAIAKGNPEPGETPEQTGIREMHEETGIPYEDIKAIDVVASEKVSNYMLHVFSYRLDHKVDIMPTDEAIGQWYSIKQAQKVIRRAHKSLLDKFIQKL